MNCVRLNFGLPSRATPAPGADTASVKPEMSVVSALPLTCPQRHTE